MKLIRGAAYLLLAIIGTELGLFGAAFLGVALGRALMDYAS